MEDKNWTDIVVDPKESTDAIESIARSVLAEMFGRLDEAPTFPDKVAIGTAVYKAATEAFRAGAATVSAALINSRVADVHLTGLITVDDAWNEQFGPGGSAS
jgi:hypothetical protein